MLHFEYAINLFISGWRFAGFCRKLSWALCRVELASDKAEAAWQKVSVHSSRQSPQEWKSLSRFTRLILFGLYQYVKHVFSSHIWTKILPVFRIIFKSFSETEEVAGILSTFVICTILNFFNWEYCNRLVQERNLCHKQSLHCLFSFFPTNFMRKALC